MITFKPCCNYRRRDGTFAVRIRVTFARQSRYITTTLTAYPEQLSRSGKIKDGGLLASCDNLIRQMRDAVSDLNPFALEGRDTDWVVAYIRQKLAGSSFRLDFFSYAETYLAGKTERTAAIYRTALNAFARYLGKREIDINDITRPLMQSFIRDAKSDNPCRGEGANSRQALALAAIFRAARNTYNDGDAVNIPRMPFDGLELKLPPSQGQKALDIATMQRIISARPDDRNQAVALAAFVVSFGLMGANFEDMRQAPKFKGRTWNYERAKTRTRRADRARMQVEVDTRLDYHLSLLEGAGHWWLPALRRYEESRATQHLLNTALKVWATAEGIAPFTFYAARHSWATIARGLGIEKATVDECLAHIGDFKITDIYAERDWRRINDANRKVLDAFSWA